MKNTLLSMALAALMIPAAVHANITADDKEKIEEIIHDYVSNHPEIIIAAMQKLEMAEQAKMQAAINVLSDKLRRDNRLPHIGSAKAKHYIIEFFDFNCGYCKVMEPYFKKAVEEKDLQIVYVNIPVIKKESEQLAIFGQAIYSISPEKYFEFHDYYMKPGMKGSSTEDLKKLCDEIGVNFDEVLEKLKSKEPQRIVNESVMNSRELNISGTPYLIIDGQEVRGAVTSYDALLNLMK